MKKFFIFVLIFLTYSIGVVSVASACCLDPKQWYTWVLFFVGLILIFLPAFDYWEKYFKKLFE